MSIDQLLEWFQSNWGETGLISGLFVLIARFLWNHAKAWRLSARKWFRSSGTTKTIGITKHRDQDDHAVLSWRVMGRDFEIHASGKYVDAPSPKIRRGDASSPESNGDDSDPRRGDDHDSDSRTS